MTVKGTHPGAGDAPDAVAASAADNGCMPGCVCSAEKLPGVPEEIVVLRVAGEIDLNSQASLKAALSDSLHPNPRHIVVDLAAVTFCGVRGLTLLADAAADATAGTTRLVVSGLSAHLERIATMLWEPGRPTRYRSVAVAVTALRAEQARHDEAPCD